MQVKLINYMKGQEETIVHAFRTCWSSFKLSSKASNKKMLQYFMENGESPLEFSCFVWELKDVSRSFLAQITRHRIGTGFAVQSMRYVDVRGNSVVVPPSILHNKKAVAIFQNSINIASSSYKRLIDECDIKKQDARYLLPIGTTTTLIVTMNLRAFLHFIKLRISPKASGEIKEVAEAMLETLKTASPLFYECLHQSLENTK